MSADIRRAALNLLARRDYSRAELVARLARRFGNDPAIADVLAQLAAEGVQSDARFAEGFVRYRRSQGKGPRRIATDLRARGVEVSNLDADDADWLQQAQAVHQKKFGDAPVTDAADYNRRVRFLLYRGFDHGIVRQVLAQSRRQRSTTDYAGEAPEVD